jgi:hypothetical protein
VTVSEQPEQPEQLSVVSGVPVVRPEPEIDLGNADRLRLALLRAMTDSPAVVVVDMTDTSSLRRRAASYASSSASRPSCASSR